MEKAKKYSSGQGMTEGYSVFKEKIREEDDRRSEIRKHLEIALDAMGQAVAIEKRMREEWEAGNLAMTPEIDELVGNITKEFMELMAKASDLYRQYNEVSQKIAAYLRQDIKESLDVARMDKSQDANKMN